MNLQSGFGDNMILIPSDKKTVTQKQVVAEIKKEVFAAEEVKKEKKEKKVKGNGMLACLDLIKSLTSFQEELESCIEAQDIDENTQKLEAFNDHLDNMYTTLFDMARGGIKANRKESEPAESVTTEVPTSISSVSVPVAPTI